MKKEPRTRKLVEVPEFINENEVFETKKSTNPWVIGFALVAIVALIVVGVMKRNRDQMMSMKTTIIPSIIQKLDPSVTVKEVLNLREVNGLYQFELQLDVKGQAQKFTSYITKDGKLFFTGGVNVADLNKKETTKANTAEPKKMTCNDLKKNNATSVTAFIVANCPFGLQMQRVMKKAIAENEQLKKYVNVKYIGSVENGKITSMHGDKEAQENLRQICIREEQKDFYWPYVNCYMQAGKSEECVKEVGVNISSLTSCMSDGAKGLAYAKKDFDLSDKYQIGSSPTFLVNDQVVSEFDFGGRNSNALKDLICCSSSVKGDFCGKELSKTDAATAFSVSDDAGDGSSAAANCGN